MKGNLRRLLAIFPALMLVSSCLIGYSGLAVAEVAQKNSLEGFEASLQEKSVIERAEIVVPESSFYTPALSFSEMNNESISTYSTRAATDIFQTVYNGKYNDVSWSLNQSTGVLTISGTGDIYRGWYYQNTFLGDYIQSVQIASGITGIQEGAFYQCKNLKSVSIPNSVTSIGYAAFGECELLGSVTIPDSVSEIGECAFLSCTALRSINIPESVLHIGNTAFGNCTALTTATIHGEIGADAFNNCIMLSTIQIGGMIEYIGDRAFAYCTSLTSVHVPDSVIEIGFGAFAYCESMVDATINGYLLESAFDCCYSLKNVAFGGSCISIGKRTFADCRSITRLTLPDSLEVIEEGAFQNCTELVSIALPSQLMVLENRAFFGCSSLRSIAIPPVVAQIEEALFANCTALEEVYLHDGITAIYDGAFGNCSALTEISISDHCDVIGEYAFYGCKALRSVVLPSGLSAVEAGTFYECTSLENIVIPNSVRIVSDHAFAKCAKLASVVLLDGLETIGKYSFASCEKLVNIALPDSVMSIGEGLFFSCSSLIDIEIPGRVTVIPEGSFYGCTSLQTLTLNSKIEAIDEWAFMDCASLKGVVLPDSLKKIGKAAFARCETIETVTLPESVTLLEDAVFLGCSSLRTVMSKGNILGIGEYTFSDCKSLTTLSGFSTITTVGNYAFANAGKLIHSQYPSLESIGEGAFAYCEGLTELVIGAELSVIGDMAFAGCTNLENIIVSSANGSFITDGHILYSKDMTRLIACTAKGTPYDVIIPDTVRNISKYAFYQCSEIQRVSLPSGLTSIEDNMFFGCTGIQKISIPDTVSSIGEYAFANCSSLESIVCPTGLTGIGEGAFLGCSSLQNIDLNNCALTAIPSYMLAGCTSLRNFSFPNTVTLIGEYAFSECSFDGELRIPDSVSKVSDFAFKESKGITSVIFPEAVTSLGRCAFEGSEDLSGVSFEGDIYAIGAGAFQNTPLKDAYFSGNAPGVIGKDAFSDSGERVLLHYNEAGESWTMPVWEGPDGITYRTSTVITGDCGKALRWKLVTHSGILMISGTGEMYDSKTPKETPWYEYASLIQSVVIEEGVTSIGAYAFSGIDTLVEVSIPSTVTKAGYGAFANSRNIQVVNTNGGLKAVSKCMFYNDDQMTSICFASELAEIPEYAFYGCCNMKDITIPESVSIIGEGAFASCSSMEKLTLQGELDSIGQGAFFNCDGLSKIYLMGEPPQSVGEYAFYGCASGLSLYGKSEGNWLETETSDVVSYDSLDIFSGSIGNLSWEIDIVSRKLKIWGSGSIPDYAQGEAPWVEHSELIASIELSEGVTGIGDYAFSGMKHAWTISLPGSLEHIGQYALAGCSSIGEVDIPAGVRSIGEGAFAYCGYLSTINLPESVRQIPDYLFFECYMLEDISCASSITDVGYGAFYACASMEELNGVESVQKIGGWAFAFCSSLRSDIHISGSVGDYAFFGCGEVNTIVLDGVSEMGEYAFSQSGIVSIVIPGTLREISVSAFELCEELSEVVCESGVSVIGEYAFYGCPKLTSLDLGTVSTLQDFCFMATGLTTVQLPNHVSEVGTGVFADCLSLTSIAAGGSFISVDGVLYQNGTLLQFPAGKMTGSYSTPDFVESIADYAFYGCRRLIEVSLGNRVSSMGKAAFVLCEGLESITLGSGISELPDAAFGEACKLKNVRFMGNAPDKIGTDAFGNVSDQLKLQYFSGMTGWTDSTWTGPDQVVYSTERLEDKFVLSVEHDGEAGVGGLSLFAINEGHCERMVAIAVAAMDGDKTVATQTRIVALGAGESKEFSIFVSGSAADLNIEAFLLDGNSYAPLTNSCVASGIEAISDGQFGVVISDTMGFEMFAVPMSGADLEEEDGIEPASVNGQQEYAHSREASIVVSRNAVESGDIVYEKVVSSRILIDESKLVDANHDFKNGGFVSLQIDGSGVRVNLDASRSAIGDYRDEPASFLYFDVISNTELKWRDDAGNLQWPDFTIKNTAHMGMVSIMGGNDFIIGDHKVKLKGNIEVFSGDATADLSTKGELNIDAQANITNHKFQIDVEDKETGEKVFTVEGNVGAGAGVGVGDGNDVVKVQALTDEEIAISISPPGSGKGYNAGVNVRLNHKEMRKIIDKKVKEMGENAKAYLKSKLNMVSVEYVDEEGKSKKVAEVAYTVNDEDKIEEAWIMSGNRVKYQPGDKTYCEALPKSEGGKVMPPENVVPKTTGSKDTTTVVNKLTPHQKLQLASALLGMPVNKLSGAELIINLFAQQSMNTQIIWTNVGAAISGMPHWSDFIEVVPQLITTSVHATILPH